MNFLTEKYLDIPNTQGFENFTKLLNLIQQNIRIQKNHIRVKMLCNWCSSKELCDDWNRMSKGDYKWNKIEITWEDNNIDFWVIINKPQPNDFFIPDRTIIFHMEPWCGDESQKWGVKTWGEWSEPDEYKFLQVRSHKNYYNNGFWQLKMTYTQLSSCVIEKTKSNRISTICSSKYFDPGHIKRIDFLKYIESKNDPDVVIDIYNHDNKHNFKNYMGKHPDGEKDIGIVPYKYYFMAENNIEHNFITEKIWEPLLTESLCFYWGCPNIRDYIDERAFVQLDLNDFEKSFQTIRQAIMEDWWSQRIDIIKRERQKVLNYYNFFPTLERVLNDLSPEPYSTSRDIMYNKYLKNVIRHTPKNICFIHSCNINHNTNILNTIFTKISTNNIFDYIIINNIGSPISTNTVDEKIIIINSSRDIGLWEIPTIKLISSFAKYHPTSRICYLHSKGVSYTQIYPTINDWFEYMLYCNINKQDIALSKLETHDTVGCNLLKSPKPHYSGNFWWANANYINTLDTKLLKEKHDAEFWLLSNKDVKSYEIHNSGINHYESSYPPEEYIDSVFCFNNTNSEKLLSFIKKYQSSAWMGHLEFAMWIVNRFRPNIIVELGVDWAHSTFAFGSEGIGKVYGIDCFEGDIHAGHRNTLDKVKNVYQELLNTKLIPRDNIQFIKGYFDDVAKNWDDSKKIDILHIDGLHTYEAVKNDFENWFPKTSEDAVILFHDIYAFSNTVGKFFNELEYPKTSVSHSAGLGIVSRKQTIIDTINKNWISKLKDSGSSYLTHLSSGFKIDKLF